ncbi:MAG: redoxin family protein, partial [Rubripirellula sp.]
MKKLLALFCAVLAIVSLTAAAKVSRSDDIRTRIMRLFPQADTNGDGIISDKEEEALGRLALARHPDADGDGALSTKETHALLTNVAQKIQKHTPNRSSQELPEAASSGKTITSTTPSESPVRRGPQLIKPGEYGIGKQIPPLSFTDITGLPHSLSDFADKKAIVFAMTGTGCPLCLKYAPTLARIEQQYRGRGVEFIFVNPNQSEQLQALNNAVQTHGFKGPYVQDGKRDLPKALQANTTTEVFVLDRARTLVYRGAVDDQYGFGYALQAPRRDFLADALEAVLEGRTPDTQATTSPGCELSYEAVDAAGTPVTYHNRISRIIQANCLDCHRTGGTAPMAFERYTAVKDYAGMIADVVERKIMPPWFAVPTADQQHDGPHTLHWANDRSLSAAEKDDLISWINAGAPEGDPADKPLAKHYPDGWLIGKPDATFRLPHPIQVQATGIMPYQYATVETDLPEDKWVKAIEIRPSALDVVHHVIVSIKSESRGAKKVNEFWAGYAPGNSTWVYPDGYARRLP